MTIEDSQKKSGRFTYEKRLGNRNLDRVPVARGPMQGLITEWYTMTVRGVSKICCIPDQWAEKHGKMWPYLERIPDSVPDSEIGYLPNYEPELAWRVEEVEHIDSAGSSGFRLFVTPIYYGEDEDGPKVGEVLTLGEAKS